MPSIREHIDRRGRSTFEHSLERLDRNGERRVRAALRMLESGSLSNVRYIADGVWERRIDSGPGYRIYYAWEQGSIILLLAGAKDTQGNLNRGDIAHALQLWSDHH